MIHRSIDDPIMQLEIEAYAELHPGPEDMVLDIGACVGSYSRKCIQAGASVIAVEPDPANYVELCANVPTASHLNMAVAKCNGYARLFKGDVNSAHCLEDNRKRNGDYLLVRTITLPWLTRLGANIIKVDVEESEWKLDYSKLPNVTRIAIEFHNETKHRHRDNIRPCLKMQQFRLVAQTRMPPHECVVEVWAK